MGVLAEGLDADRSQEDVIAQSCRQASAELAKASVLGFWSQLLVKLRRDVHVIISHAGCLAVPRWKVVMLEQTL